MADSDNEPWVTVIGAGIVGICCTLSLLERGYSVRLIDRAAPATGASLGNAGVISPWSCVPQSLPGLWRHVPGWLLDPKGPISIRWLYLPQLVPWALRFLRAGQRHRIPAIATAMEALTRPNVELYRKHLADTGHEDLLRDSWYVHPFRDPAKAELSDLPWRLRQERGAPVERIDAQTLREIEPALSHDYEAAILVKGQARATSPGRLGAVLADKARNMGAKIVQTSIKALKPGAEGGWKLLTSQGELRSPNVVISAGAWSAALLKPLGIVLPLEAERGYHLTFEDPGVTLNNSIMDMEAKFVVSSMEGGVRSAGTAEFAGLDVLPNYRRARIFESLTKRLLPGINTAKTREWMGTRPSFPDSLPCLGPVPGFEGLYAAFGHSHYGMGMAPATGLVIANLLTASDPGIDLQPYRIDRFH
jgi:D-amino-acid dehydrogenase